MDKSATDLEFSGPAIYQIIVKGKIPVPYHDRFGEMRIEFNPEGSQGIETILVGKLQDQAELSGILKTIYSLHLPVKNITLKENDL